MHPKPIKDLEINSLDWIGCEADRIAPDQTIVWYIEGGEMSDPGLTESPEKWKTLLAVLLAFSLNARMFPSLDDKIAARLRRRGDGPVKGSPVCCARDHPVPTAGDSRHTNSGCHNRVCGGFVERSTPSPTLGFLTGPYTTVRRPITAVAWRSDKIVWDRFRHLAVPSAASHVLACADTPLPTAR